MTDTNPVVSEITLSRPAADNVEFDQGTGVITITQATSANAGNYTCTADNGQTTPTTITFVLRIEMSSTTEPTTMTTPTLTTDSAGELMIFFSLHTGLIIYDLLFVFL